MFYTYILASRRNGTIYVGSTDGLVNGVVEHREKVRQGFTARHGVTCLVWYEPHESREAAFRRERRIKEWRRSWKIMLIEAANPTWTDLFDDLAGGPLDLEAWFRSVDVAAGTAAQGLPPTPAKPPAHPGECRDPDR